MLTYIIIYFLYGLAFFSMGILVALEGGRSSDERLRKALRPLYGFGIVHGVYEFLKMFDVILVQLGHTSHPGLVGVELAMLAFSFLSLAAFGSFLLSKTETAQRVSLIVPLALETIWVFGLAVFHEQYTHEEMLVVTEVWTRYSIAIPATLLAAIGLVAQQRAFRRAGLVRFGQDSLWAAVAFAWYGLVGQFFTAPSPLFPSNIINSELFLRLFGFPVQIFRAVMASTASFFVIRFLRAFQVESDAQIAGLKEERLRESEQRQELQRELFRRVVGAQEAERQRIARDLHDETGQSLTAIGLGLRGLENTLTKDPARASDMLHKLETLATDSLSELQRLITDLRPSHLDDLGLPAALRWYAGKVSERTGLKIRVDIFGEEKPISEPIKIATFRIMQEAFNNTIKHAGATSVFVQLSFESERVHISIRDDGNGFDPELVQMRQTNRPSLGLAGMRERASLLGGTVSLQSGPGQGTLIEAIIPCAHESEVRDDDSPVAGG
ncbi:MAG: sensor histidine kinase [Anaerolineaceae bacterium]|nr:MAG: sensor histidine kinase [Anaerolineaceae bacterium]